MPYQGVALAVLLGVGLATAAVLYFLSQREAEPFRNNGRPPPDNPGSYTNSWEHRNGNTKRRRKRPTKNEPLTCTICLEDLSDDVKSLPCQHMFHSQCINTWIRLEASRGCPLCRKCATM